MKMWVSIWDAVKVPFRILYKVYFLVVFFGVVVSIYPYARWLLKEESRWPRAFRLVKRCTRFIRVVTGIAVRYRNNAGFPDPPYVVVANHASYIDTFLLYAAIPDYFVFMGKGELGSWPFFRVFFTSGMNILVHRNSKVASHRAYMEAFQHLDRGHCIAIFPEGGIPAQAPKLARFKNGAFRLALEKGVPIVPVTLVNSFTIFESNKLYTGYGGPDLARIEVHPALETQGLTDRDLVPLRERTFQIIQQAIPDKWK